MMIHQREDHLGLTLSLNFQTETHQPSSSSSPLKLNQTPSTTHSHFNLLHNTSLPKQTSDRSLFETCRVETRSFLKGIDVNRLPAMMVEMEEEAAVSSPNSTISSSLSGKRRSLERSELGNSDDIIDCDDEDGDNSRKKLRLSKDQAAILEDSFKEHNTLNPKQKLALAKRLGLRPRQVEVWFQNRRARTKLKQTEVDCEFLKRCCENLTEENRRLQKEVQDLRALKSSPQFYMQMAPPTTLTMCPSCERVSAPPSSAASPSTTPVQPRHSTSNHHRVPFNPWAIAPAAPQPLNAVHHRS
ncbi:homeobox-leucine zipper protein HAT4-like [Heracleum sosnowskyi]|uniref:Homeobox-leucine zipper protein HAT4-like n=1 Tax=Heracleum sosnowskyi TaxID=360622 RepID=A0AAD8MKZ0_9APIA|nr:homeobox-leucine zipper protein HAT4-like [Heracleum sosnowskyi]